jgi:zinc transport system substrate-binding protein
MVESTSFWPKESDMKRASVLSILVFAVLSFVGTANATEKIQAFVSILPQAEFVKQVGGPHVEVDVLVGPGQSPATYEPTPKQMARLSQADVLFRIGTPFEKGFIERVAKTHKNLKIVDTRKGVPLRYFEGAKGGEAPDPHIWLAPHLVRIQAATICEALSGLAPEHRQAFERNLALYQDALDRVDRKIAQTLAPLKGSSFYVFHPAFGYFGDRYGLEQVAVEIAGKEPTPRQLADLIQRARAEKVRVVFVQPQYSKKEAETIADEIGGAVVPINPLPENYLENLEAIAEALKAALESRSLSE